MQNPTNESAHLTISTPPVLKHRCRQVGAAHVWNRLKPKETYGHMEAYRATRRRAASARLSHCCLWVKVTSRLKFKRLCLARLVFQSFLQNGRWLRCL